MTPRPERGDAEVTCAAELVDDNGDTVLELINHSILPLRDATTSATESA